MTFAAALNCRAEIRPLFDASRTSTAPQGMSAHSAKGSIGMADDRTVTGQADRLRINMNEDYEVRYWTQKWNVSREELAAAVREAGVMVKDVAKRLGKES
jgi:hypothetical protein